MPRGLVVWLTGLSGSGKITIARTVEEDVLKGKSVVENSFL
jgi:adenylylsulfate kinase-like enzyme